MSKKHSFLISFSLLIGLNLFIVITPGDYIIAQDTAPIRFAIIGDRTGGPVQGIYDSIVIEIELLRPDFVITIGDMIEGPADDTMVMNSRWQEYLDIVKPLTMPLYFTPGNNDIYSDLSFEWYRNHVAQTYYSFNHQNLHFIILDNSRIEKSADFTPEQINWLIDDLKNNQQAAYTFVFMHKPFWYETTAENKPDTLHSLFVNFGVDAVYCGHYHEYFSGVFDGVRYTTIGSSGGHTDPSPNGLEFHYGWVTVDSKGIHQAVLNLGSVMPQDIIKVAERKTYRYLEKKGLSFEPPLPVDMDLKVKTTTSQIILNNLSDFPLDDTLRWEIPEGWTVTPNILPMQVPTRMEQTFTFTASSTGPLFPVPTAVIDFTYGEGKKFNVKSSLKIARTAECYPVEGSMKIDGKLDESFWQNPATQLFSNEGESMVIDPVAFYYAYDKDNLYLAAKCTDRQIDSLKAKTTQHDGAVSRDDCVGYFIEPLAGNDTVYQLYFNPLGTSYDYKIWRQEDGFFNYSEWNGEYEIKTSKDKDSWTIEIRIPVKQFGLESIKPGDKWEINFRRKQPRLGAADWQIPLGYPDYSGGWLIMR